MFASLLAGPGCVPTTHVPGGTASTALTATDNLILAVGDPPVTVIQYASFECPICKTFAAQTFPTIMANYIDTGRVRWVFRNLPFSPTAGQAAQASECAADQGRFLEYHDVLFANQGAFDVNDLKGYAGDLGLDASAFETCLDSRSKAGEVQADVDSARAAGINTTPTFVIGSAIHPGLLSVDQMSMLLDAELAAIVE